METKKCSKCNNFKPLTLFWHNRAKCKKCIAIYNNKAVAKYRATHKRTDLSRASNEEFRRIRKTFLGHRTSMYSHIRTRIRDNKYYQKFECSFSREEFYLFLKKTDYPILYKVWRESGFDKALTPSVDRLNNHKGYDLANIRIVPLQVNWMNK